MESHMSTKYQSGSKTDQKLKDFKQQINDCDKISSFSGFEKHEKSGLRVRSQHSTNKKSAVRRSVANNKNIQIQISNKNEKKNIVSQPYIMTDS